MNMLVNVENLGFSYADEPFMEDLHLAVPDGSVCALLGPNGSGKTTLLMLLLGLLKPRSGTITFAGQMMQSGNGFDSKRVTGLVPQEETLPFDLSVLEYVLLGRAPYFGLLERPGKAERELARDALTRIGIPELERRAVPSLSGGERQLAMVARVMVQDPRVFLMDEPTSHLDIGNTRRILGLMRSLRDAGKTVIFSTHDPNAATAVADHVFLINRGKIHAQGTPAQVLTAENLSRVYQAPIEVCEIKGRPWVMID